MGRRLALLIATDAYSDPGLSRLRAPAQEAQRLAELLADPSVGRFEKPKVLTNRPRVEAEAAIEDLLTGRLPDDLVLLYIAGHGLTSDADRLYFATIDTRLAKRESTSIRASYVRDLLDDSQARAKVVLLDCCYSGIFAADTQGRADRRADIEQQVLGRGSYAITSTTSLAYSYEGERFADNGQPASAFTHAVIEGIRTGRADIDRDGIITPDNLHEYVHDVVVKQIGADQRPMMKKAEAAGRVELAYAPIHDDSDADAVGGRLALGELLDAPIFVHGRGLTCEAWEGTSRLRVPVGRHEGTERGETAVARLHDRDGNVAVVGKSGSGKTNLIRTLITSLALTHTPNEAEFYLLEGAVNGLGGLLRLPHVRRVAAPHETEDVESIANDVLALITERQKLYRAHGFEAVQEFRDARADGTLPAGGHPDVFLVIDSWWDFAAELPLVAGAAQKIANSGLHYGFHLVVTSRRWQALPEDLTPLIETKYELALDDPATSKFDATLSAMLSTGRGLVRGKPFRAALPVLEADGDPSMLKRSAIELLESVRKAWEKANTPEPDSEDPDTEPAGQPSIPASGQVNLAALLGLPADTPIDPATLWRPLSPQDKLRALIGTTPNGTPLELDFKGAGQGGFGPCCLVVGTPDSGRQELLRAIVLSLALTHSPDEVNFLLVDVGAAGTFRQMDALSHAAGVITGLADDLPLVERMAEAISGELRRRQELLREDRRFATVHDYERARREGASLEPLPALMIVVDDFGELLNLRPEIIDLFAMIGRLGWNLGIHLLLGAQRLEEGDFLRLGEFLSYRIALRTLSAAESRLVIGDPSAHLLLPDGGFAYLRRNNAGGDVTIKFRPATTHRPHGTSELSFADEVILALKDHGRPAHQIWLPPLQDSPTLDMLISPHENLRSPLHVPVAIVDMAFEHTRLPLLVNLANDVGNAVIVGGPLSGKSTLLQSLIAAIALLNTPEQAQILGIDYDNGALTALAGLPHVSAIANASEPDLIRRIVSEVRTAISKRPRKFRDAGSPHIILAIDGWAQFRTDLEDLAGEIHALARVGPKYGVHFALTTSRWNEVPQSLRQTMGTRLELCLIDPQSSVIHAGAAANVPVGRPGRGLTEGPSHFLAALPRIDGKQTVDDLAFATRAMVQKVAADNKSPTVPKLQVLPSLAPASDVRQDVSPNDPGFLIGIDEIDLAPVTFDFSKHKHLLIYGDSGSGKTALLRLLLREIAARRTPAEARIHLVHFDRNLLGVIDNDYFFGSWYSGHGVADMVRKVRQFIALREPGPQVTKQQLQDRSWWSGPEIFVVVDDYEFLTADSPNPLAELVSLLRDAADRGVHLVLARSSRGARLGIEESVTQTLLRNRDVGAIILSGDRSEGPLIGSVAPSKQPPGRGTLVLPGQPPQLIQVAWEPPTDPQIT